MQTKAIAGQKSWVTGDTITAAALSALPGNTIRTEVTEEVVRGGSTGRVCVMHDILGPYVEAQARVLTARDAAPRHPLLVGMLAVHAVLHLRQWIRGKHSSLCLAARTEHGLWGLQPGSIDPMHALHSGRIQTRDIAVAAALTVCGFAPLDYAGEVFTLSSTGLPIADYITAQPCTPAPAALVQRAETRNELGTRMLSVQLTEPQHPMSIAVAAAWRYRYLRHLIETGPRIIHLRPYVGAALCALVASDATGRVMDKVERHFRL